MTPLRLYWWNLRRSPRSLAAELVYKPGSWLRAARETHRLFLNFGDEMSRDIVEAAFGRRAVWSSADRADVIAVGSVLEHVGRSGRVGGDPIAVWGTGLRRGRVPTGVAGGEADEVPTRGKRYLAVRGNLTADALGLGHDIPRGDPGLLAREVYGEPRRGRGVVYVPHFSELTGWDRLTRFCDVLGADLVLPTARPAEVIREIAAAEVVYSASLHGIIVADSYGIPVVPLLPFSGAENPFKYRDYMGVPGYATPLQTHDRLVAASPREREELLDGAVRAAELRRPGVAAAKDALWTAAQNY